uniref:t-SNARE coiled-coil homology domain-containing protein n=1 Tax=Kalanchoe fedtschenkoi TaxID=63787 RepID=A0A7N0RID5_KALFE
MNDLLKDSFVIPRGGDTELEPAIPLCSGELCLEGFFLKVREIDAEYEKLQKLLKQLQDAHEESKAVTKAEVMKGIKQRMEKAVDEVRKTGLVMKAKIEAIDKDNLCDKRKAGRGEGTAIYRTRAATTLALKKKFKEKMSEFQAVRLNIHQEYREVVERRIFTVTGTRADEETIDNLIETGDSEHIFQKAIQEQGRGQILDTLAEIQERRDTVRDVEKKILELNQIYVDLAVLVEAQGDMLDNIESQVSKAVDHVQTGTTVLQKAKQRQRNSRKWMCIAVFILLVLIITVLASVLKPWTSSGGA